jgi:hypothetical protein
VVVEMLKRGSAGALTRVWCACTRLAGMRHAVHVPLCVNAVERSTHIVVCLLDFVHMPDLAGMFVMQPSLLVAIACLCRNSMVCGVTY